MPIEFAKLPLSGLSVGSVLTAPIYDVENSRTKLLGAEIEITAQFLAQLEARGVQYISVSKRDLAAMNAGDPQGTRRQVPDPIHQPSTLVTDLSQQIDQDIGSLEIDSEVADTELAPTTYEPKTGRYDEEELANATALREKQVVYMDDLFGGLVRNDPMESEGLTNVCRTSIQSVLSDKDLFLRLGLNPFSSDYPSRHSLHVCSVATSIGITLGLDDQSLVDLGTGCLVHDVGMLKLDREIYKAKRELSSSELLMLASHPILTLDALSVPGMNVSQVAKIVAYQIHERCDGSGYPRGTQSSEIHFLAKIAGVADAYVGLVSNRWHRKGMIPYYAMEKLLNSLPHGLFDPKVVRALLQTVSLYPIGSLVETNDGRYGRVVRATGQTYTKPIIELWNPKHKQFEPDLVNLAKDPSIWIQKAIARISA